MDRDSQDNERWIDGWMDGWLLLHLACEYRASLEVVQLFWEQWQEATKTTNKNGFLPMDIACSNEAPLKAIPLLVKQWPEAVEITTVNELLLLYFAKSSTGGDPIPEVIAWLQDVESGGMTFEFPRSNRLRQLQASVVKQCPKSFRCWRPLRSLTQSSKQSAGEIRKAITLKRDEPVAVSQEYT
jgi:hypothetical protein